MPETTIYKHGYPAPRENHIGADSSPIGEIKPEIASVAEACRMKSRAQGKFRTCVPASVCLHVATSRADHSLTHANESWPMLRSTQVASQSGAEERELVVEAGRPVLS